MSRGGEHDAPLRVQRLVARVDENHALVATAVLVREGPRPQALVQTPELVGGIEGDARLEALQDDERLVRVNRELPSIPAGMLTRPLWSMVCV